MMGLRILCVALSFFIFVSASHAGHQDSTVTVSAAGKILDTLVKAGANDVGGIIYSVAKRAALVDEAQESGCGSPAMPQTF